MEQDTFILDRVVKRVGDLITPNPLNCREENRPWTIYALAVLARLLPFVIYAVYVITKTTPCGFKEATGLPCFGCGGTTAVYALMRLDIPSALTSHLYFTVMSLPIVFLSGRFIVTGKAPRDSVLITLTLGMLLYGVIRILVLTI